MELKIELRAGQAVAWKRGGMLLPGAEPSPGRPWPWGLGGIEEGRMTLPEDVNVSRPDQVTETPSG